MITWQWLFMHPVVADGGVLTKIYYQLTGLRKTNNGLGTYGVRHRHSDYVQLGPANPNNFTPFEQLSEKRLIEIVGTVVDIDAIKKKIELALQLNYQPAPQPAPSETDILRDRIAQLEEQVIQLTPEPEPDVSVPPPEVLAEAQPDEDLVELKARLLGEFASLRNMLIGHIPMTEEQLLRLQALEHPKFQTWLQA